jgi:hypothetical protein
MIWIDLESHLPTDSNIPGWIPWTAEQWQAWLAESNRLSAELLSLQNAGNINARNALIDANSAHWGKLNKSMTRHDAELSAVARWCVLFRNDPQLARLVA